MNHNQDPQTNTAPDISTIEDTHETDPQTKEDLKDTEQCHFQKYSDDLEVITMHNGRKIYTLFTAHLAGSEYRRVLSALFIGPRLDDYVVTRLNNLLQGYSEFIQSKQFDAQQIRQLARSEQVDWLGLEISPEGMHEYDIENLPQAYLDERRIYFEKYHSHDQWSEEKTDQILYLMYPTYIIVQTSDPELFSETRKVPLEDDNALKDETTRLIREKDQWENTLRRMVRQQRLSLTEYRTVINTEISALQSNTPISETETVTDLFQDREVRSAISRYFNQVNALLENVKQCDEAIVSNVLNEPDNGLIILGLAHKPRVQQGLIDFCKNNQTTDALPTLSVMNQNKGLTYRKALKI